MDRIFKKSSWLILSQVLVKVISFFYTIFLARNLGVDNFGLYVAALSYFSLVAALADIGVSRFLIRELALAKNKVANLLSTAVLFRLLILSLFFTIFATTSYLFDPDKIRSSLAILAVLAVLPQSISLTIDAFFIANLKTKLSAFGSLILTAFTAVFGIFLISLGLNSYGAVIALMLGQLLQALILTVVSFKEKVPLLGKVDLPSLVSMVKGSLPYGLLAVMGFVYFKIDTLLLTYLKGSYETGIYGVAFKFLEAVVFVPTAVSTTIFPTFAKLHSLDVFKLKRLMNKVTKTMLALGIVISLGYYFILPEIIKVFLPQYLASTAAVKILSLAIPLMFVYIPLSQILLSSDKYLKLVILVSLIPLTFNISANLIFIPQFGFLAAAWISVVSDIVSLSALYFATYKVFKR